MDKELSRRGFIATSAAGVATAAAAGALTRVASATEKASAAADAAGFDEQYDLVIVGAGIAGLSAAITAALEGDGASVLLLEKGDTPGGCSPYCGGGSICTEDPDALEAYLRDLAGDFVPSDALIKAYAQGFAENYPWFQSWAPADILDLTVPMKDSSIEYEEFGTGQGVINHLHVLNPENHDDNSYTFRLMMSQIEQYPDVVTYRPSTPVIDLVQDADGRVTGVVTADARIGAAKGVILACGGFENSPEMLECFVQEGHAKSGAAQLNTGDGILMAMKAGARLWHMSGWAGTWEAPRDVDDTRFIFQPLAVARQKPKKFGITVATNGRRFYMDFDGHNIKDVDDNALYPSMSQHVGFRHGHTNFGGEWPNLPMPSKAWFIYDANGLANGAMGPDYAGDPVDDGFAYRADTIEELAALIDVPADELSATVAQWNEACANGLDAAFHRPVSSLNPVDTAPFYATLCCPTFLNTDGGPERNEKCQVVSIDGDPIPGLYEAGEIGSFWGHYYQGAGNVGECCLSARIAVRDALGIA